MEQSVTFREALKKAAELCGKSEKCGYDMEQKCREWHLTRDETARVIEFLVQEKYIDHQRYATSFVNDKFRFNQWGRIKLAYMLRQKQIEEKHIREALSGLEEEKYRGVLTSLLSSRARSIRETDSYTRRGKLLAFAQSRGFENDEALRIIAQLKSS